MNQTTSNADGNNPAVKTAAQDANAVQDAVNLIAIVGCFHRHLMALRQTGLGGDDLNITRKELIADRTESWERKSGETIVQSECLAHCFRGGGFSGVLWAVWERQFIKDGEDIEPPTEHGPSRAH